MSQKIISKTLIHQLDKHDIKIGIGLLIMLIMTFIVIASVATAWKIDKENEIMRIDKTIETVLEQQKGLQKEILIMNKYNNDKDIQIAQINTKLVNIEMLLVDIKNDLRGLK